MPTPFRRIRLGEAPMSIKLLVYRAAKAVGLFALCRVLTRSRIRVLGYHGACLGDEADYNPYLFLRPVTFKLRIDWLQKKGFTVIPLKRAVDALDGIIEVRRLPTVITFDDGWYSTTAKLIPVLLEKDLPSTLYLSTNDFRKGGPVLAVTINYMIWKSARRQIEVQSLGESIDGSYRLDDPADRDLFVQRSQQWLTDQPATRVSVIERIHSLAESMGLSKDDVALESRRFDYVSRDELLELAKQGCAVEMHGHEHRYFKGEPEASTADLIACRETIIELGLPRPNHYCYPSGNFDDAAETILNGLDIRSATTCIPGLISCANGSARRYALPRFLDGEHISMLVFEAEMSGFAHLFRRAIGR